MTDEIQLYIDEGDKLDQLLYNLIDNDVSDIIDFLNHDDRHPMEKVLDLYKRALKITKCNRSKGLVLLALTLYECYRQCPPPQTKDKNTHNLAEMNQVAYMFGLSKTRFDPEYEPYVYCNEKERNEYQAKKSEELERLWDLPPTLMPQLIPIYLLTHMDRYIKHYGLNLKDFQHQTINLNGCNYKPAALIMKDCGYLILVS